MISSLPAILRYKLPVAIPSARAEDAFSPAVPAVLRQAQDERRRARLLPSESRGVYAKAGSIVEGVQRSDGWSK